MLKIAPGGKYANQIITASTPRNKCELYLQLMVYTFYNITFLPVNKHIIIFLQVLMVDKQNQKSKEGKTIGSKLQKIAR